MPAPTPPPRHHPTSATLPRSPSQPFPLPYLRRRYPHPPALSPPSPLADRRLARRSLCYGLFSSRQKRVISGSPCALHSPDRLWRRRGPLSSASDAFQHSSRRPTSPPRLRVSVLQESSPGLVPRLGPPRCRVITRLVLFFFPRPNL